MPMIRVIVKSARGEMIMQAVAHTGSDGGPSGISQVLVDRNQTFGRKR